MRPLFLACLRWSADHRLEFGSSIYLGLFLIHKRFTSLLQNFAVQSDTTIYFSCRPASLRTFSRRNVRTAGVGWLGGSREGGGVWGQAWADAGFVVVHVQQPGSDADAVRTAQRTGLGRVSRKELASAGQLLARFQDVVVVLDQIARQKARNEKWANVRADGAGVAGHSFGAYTVLGLGGQTH